MSNNDWLAKRVVELEDENRTLLRRLHLLAETIAVLSASETVQVSDHQFSVLVREGEGRVQ